MNKLLAIIFLSLCLSSNANDGNPHEEKKELISLNKNYNHNSTTLIQVKEPEKEKTGWEKFYIILKDWSTSIIAITGFAAGYYIIRRKLIENHITKVLVDIQEANKELIFEVTQLMDLYVSKTYTIDIVRKEELEEIFESIKRLYRISQGANSGSQSTIYYLKFTIQQTIKNHDRPNSPFSLIHSRDIYGLILKTFERVTFLSTQVVQIPNSSRTETQHWFNKKLQPYVTNAEFVKYQSFNQGLEFDPDSALYTLFYADILDYSNKLFMRSTFQIYGSTTTISKFLFLSNYYAPQTITASYSIDDEENEGDKMDVQRLYLIGYAEYEPLDTSSGTTNSYVKLFYTNPIDNYGFANNLKIEQIRKKYRDIKFKKSGFSMEKLKKFNNQNDFETVELQFEKSYLESQFTKNKKLIIEDFPKIDGLIRKYLKRIYGKFKKTKIW